jgi:hypothetical protein
MPKVKFLKNLKLLKSLMAYGHHTTKKKKGKLTKCITSLSSASTKGGLVTNC